MPYCILESDFGMAGQHHKQDVMLPRQSSWCRCISCPEDQTPLYSTESWNPSFREGPDGGRPTVPRLHQSHAAPPSRLAALILRLRTDNFVTTLFLCIDLEMYDNRSVVIKGPQSALR